MAIEPVAARPAGLAPPPGPVPWRSAGNVLAVTAATLLLVAPVIAAALLLDQSIAALRVVLVADLVALFAFALATLSRPAVFIGVLVLWFALQMLAVAIAAPHVQAYTL